MEKRQELQTLLETILGSREVYYQPPESVRMSYPSIVYSRDNIENRHANDGVYNQMFRYTVTVIDRNPDSDIVKEVSKLPLCRHDRHYATDGLNHDVFTLYY